MELIAGAAIALVGAAFGALIADSLERHRGRRDAVGALDRLELGLRMMHSTLGAAESRGLPFRRDLIQARYERLAEVVPSAAAVLHPFEAEAISLHLDATINHLITGHEGQWQPQPIDVSQAAAAWMIIDWRQKHERLSWWPWNWRARWANRDSWRANFDSQLKAIGLDKVFESRL